MRLVFADGSRSTNYMGLASLRGGYQNDAGHRTEYLSVLWNTLGLGTGEGGLREFELDCMAQSVLAKEYKVTLNAPASTSEAFLQEHKLEHLGFLCAKPPCSTLTEYGGRFLETENRSFWDELLRSTVWDHNCVRTFRLLLILLLQLKQGGRGKLEPEEEAVLVQALQSCQLAALPQTVRIYPFQGGALSLRAGKIHQTTFSTEGEPQTAPLPSGTEVLLDFAPYAGMQRVEVAASGKLTDSTAPSVVREWTAHGRPPLAGTACCGNLYLLLRRDSGLLSNVKDVAGRWKDILRVGAGLNSLSAICGDERKLYASIPVEEHRDVREAVTYYDGGQTHYGAILEDGTLIVDGRPVGRASCVAICSLGVAFAREDQIFLYWFDQKRTVRAAECSGEVRALCVEDGTAFTPPRLQILWMTDKGVGQVCLNV